MSIFAERLREHLETIEITAYQLCKRSKLSQTVVYNVVNGNRAPSDKVLEAFSRVEDLKLNYKTLRSWRAADEYPELNLEVRLPSYLRSLPKEKLAAAGLEHMLNVENLAELGINLLSEQELVALIKTIPIEIVAKALSERPKEEIDTLSEKMKEQ